MGIDGLVPTEGIAYQAYGQEFDNKDPVAGVRKKIRTDLAKLKKYENEIREVLDNQKIQYWVLLLNRQVPSSSIHSYAKTKEKEVKDWNLSIIHPKFQVVLCDPTFFKTEYLEYAKKKDDRIEVDIQSQNMPSMDSIRLNPNFIKIAKKFTHITDQAVAEKLAFEEIKAFLQNMSQLDQIRKEQPDFYSEIEEIRSEVEIEAEQGTLLSGTFESFSQTKNTLFNRLTHQIGERLGPKTLSRVQKFIIADWLVRCPLSFKNDKDKL